MAYNCYYSQTYSTLTDFFDRICAGVVAAGWTLYDDVSATVKVYKTQGEGDQYSIPGYIKINTYLTVDVEFTPYLYWNNTTHVGTTKAYHITTYHTLKYGANEPLCIYGDKNFIIGWTGVNNSQSYYKTIAFGFLPNIYDDTVTTSTAPVSAGAGVTLNVNNTSGFVDDSYYMMIGTSSEGRDPVHVNSIDSSTTMTITNMPRAYASGATIGAQPFPFGMSYSNLYNWISICSYFGSVGTADNLSSHTWSNTALFTISEVDPDIKTNRWFLQPLSFKETSATSYYKVGYTGNNIYYTPANGFHADIQNDMYTLGDDIENGSVTSATVSGVTDSSKSWVTDEWADKIVLITDGTGLGQSRVVASNTATTLNLNTNWYITPVSLDLFQIVDEVYRAVDYIACKETV